MGKKVITFELSVESIDAAIKEIEKFKSEMETKLARLRELVATRVAWSASAGFSTALTSDIFSGGQPLPSDVDVTVTSDDNSNVSIVIANGEDAVFIEFGAGVYYNGSAGSSPHPWTDQNPTFLIGEYGKGYGKKNVWALPKEMWTETTTDKDGNVKVKPMLTHGTPAAMPMYRGVQDALRVIGGLAQEVFGE